MKICVASAHVRCNRAALWRRLQWQFLKETTTSEFEYHIIASAINSKPFEKHATSVTHSSDRLSHSTCLRKIIDIFESSTCTHCLLLDSDCWPIRDGWDTLLASKLGDYKKFAAVVRPENLDIFPHPSAVFFPRAYLMDLDFGFKPNKNMIGKPNADVGSALGMYHCFPLLKTNYISPHPVYASIYGDYFYHHCAGSRGIGVRCADYYKHMITTDQQEKIYSKITEQLQKRPHKFINELRGVWSRTQNSAIEI